MRSVFLLLGFLVLSVSCQKKEKRPSVKCIYDQPVFAEASRDLDHFKRNPYFNLLWENKTEEEGWAALKKIEREFPFLIELLPRFRSSDAVGSPKVYSYGEYGEFSPYTLYLIALAGELIQHCGSIDGQDLVQIGAGYGGLCKILHDIAPFKSYTLVDIPEQLQLAQKYLESIGIRNVHYLTPEQLSKEAKYDIAFSDQSFSEYNCAYQNLFIDKIISRVRIGFCVGHVFPKHFGVVALNPDELRKKLRAVEDFSELNFHEPENDRGIYLFKWKGV